MIYQLGQTEKAAALFAGWQETMIWSCMQGVMGKIYVNSLTDPVSAMAILGDFCFLTGKPDKEMVLYPFGPADREILIMIPREDAWAGQIEACYGKRAKKPFGMPPGKSRMYLKKKSYRGSWRDCRMGFH